MYMYSGRSMGACCLDPDTFEQTIHTASVANSAYRLQPRVLFTYVSERMGMAPCLANEWGVAANIMSRESCQPIADGRMYATSIEHPQPNSLR